LLVSSLLASCCEWHRAVWLAGAALLGLPWSVCRSWSAMLLLPIMSFAGPSDCFFAIVPVLALVRYPLVMLRHSAFVIIFGFP